ncbi:MAG: GWxTD domain-containing protein [Candidatus Aminicenantales bacterium]
MRSWRGGLLLCLGLAAILAACASAGIEKGLDPESREFFSKVRLIITPEERRTFLSLPAEKRKEFIQDFWARRDPTPGTPKNEYKEEYFRRIEQANHLFSGGGSPGWLQDRGRVYITLGPPDTRETYPRGMTFYGLPTEIWWYGFFSIIFVDERWVDDYRLDPQSAMQIGEINTAQQQWNEAREKMPKMTPGGAPPELNVKVQKGPTGGASILITLPYRNIWMKVQGDRFQATLELTLKVLDASGTEVWKSTEKYPLDIPENRLKEVLVTNFEITVSAPLSPGVYTLNLSLTNANDGSRAEVKQKFEI